MRFAQRRKRLFLLIAIAGIIVIGVWWWQWQAPYRTLMAFLNALERGDLETLYALTPSKERQYGIVTMDLIRRTYEQLLRPQLINRYRLVGIKRTSPEDMRPELWIRSIAVRFYLDYQDAHGNTIQPPLVVYVACPIHGKVWRIPFSYFVYTTAHSLIGFDESQGDAWMYRVGYRFFYLHDGKVEPLKPPR